MGMAASQARLLQLTSRLHDIEYKAQNIEGQKIALATQKDELYQNYCDALDAKKIQVAFRNGDGSKTFVDANFNTVCGYQPDRMTQYTLTDSRTGKIIVPQDVYDAYYGTNSQYSNYQGYSNDKFCFAWAMMGYEQFNPSSYGEGERPTPVWGDGQNIGLVDMNTGDLFAMTWAEEQVYNAHTDDEILTAKYKAFQEAEGTNDKKKALKTFREYLYSKFAKEIFEKMNLVKTDGVTDEKQEEDATFDQALFDYYVKLFEQIEAAGGCQPVEEQYVSGDDGNTWFNNMVNSGLVTVQEYSYTGKEWRDVSVGTSTSSSYLQKVSDDTDLKRAEAEYEYELSIVNNKDSKFDTELSKLETERTAITTEMDAIKKVKDDNIERTFGIFS